MSLDLARRWARRPRSSGWPALRCPLACAAAPPCSARAPRAAAPLQAAAGPTLAASARESLVTRPRRRRWSGQSWTHLFHRRQRSRRQWPNPSRIPRCRSRASVRLQRGTPRRVPRQSMWSRSRRQQHPSRRRGSRHRHRHRHRHHRRRHRRSQSRSRRISRARSASLVDRRASLVRRVRWICSHSLQSCRPQCSKAWIRCTISLAYFLGVRVWVVFLPRKLIKTA